ncbi:TonB-dependent receptor [Kordiimonas pumila]|uniref:TonB-dependent receptor n=1 Tax=Kordiimonas pumila TaxID=2161677 RepID=A0ABV7D7J2_9PROT|nr:TonB-dependent receptor [Kordiimonas pumila]
MKVSQYAVLAALPAMVLSTTGTAQSTVEQNIFAIEEIVVSAQRRQESMQDIPVAVSALDAKRIRESGFEDIEDLSAVAPNLHISALWGTSSPKIFMRGIGNNNFNQTAESKIAVYLDQVYLSAPSGQLFQMYDLERIEVLRGPQGTLYGKNATGGAISVYSKLPEMDGETDGYVSASYGNYDAMKFEGAATVPLSETLSARVAGTYSKRDGYLTDARNGEKVNDIDEWAARGIIRWQPNADVDLKLNIHGGGSSSTHNNSVHRGIFDPVALGSGQFVKLSAADIIAGNGVDILGYQDPNPDPYVNTYEGDTFAKIDLVGVSLVGDFSFGDGYTITTVSGFEQSKRHVLQEGNGAPSTIFTIDWGPSTFRSYSQEIRLSSPDDGAFSWLIGAFAFTEKGDVNNFYNMASVNFALGFDAFNQFYVQHTDTYAAFAQGSYDITDKFTLTLGGRINYEKRDVDHQSYATDSARTSVFPGPLFDVQLEESWSEWSGRAALDYKISDDILAFISMNRGFTSGGFNTGAFNDPLGAAEIYNPEVILSYEAGLKTTLLNKRVRFNTTAFLYDYSDLQVFTFNAAGQQFIENASDAEVKGLEFELQALVTQNLEIGVSAGFLDSEYKNFTRANGATVEDLSGNKLIGAPSTQLNLVATYTLPTEIGDFALRGDFSYTSNRYYDERELDEISSEGATTNLNASLKWTSKGENIEASLWARNLTNEVNIIDVVEVGLFGYQNVWYNTPRTYGISLSYMF